MQMFAKKIGEMSLDSQEEMKGVAGASRAGAILASVNGRNVVYRIVENARK